MAAGEHIKSKLSRASSFAKEEFTKKVQTTLRNLKTKGGIAPSGTKGLLERRSEGTSALFQL